VDEPGGIGGFQLVDVASGKGQVWNRRSTSARRSGYHAVLHSATAKEFNMEMSIFSARDGARPASVGDAADGHEAAGVERDGCDRSDSVRGEAGAARLRTKDRCAIRARVRRGALLCRQRGDRVRTPADEMAMVSLHPKVTTSGGPIDAPR